MAKDKLMVGIHFGAMSPDIAAQLKEQKFKFVHTQAVRFQKFADAITMLHVHDLITESETDKARQRLMRKINRHLAGNN